MIFDGHAYCFPSLRGDGGFDDPDTLRRPPTSSAWPRTFSRCGVPETEGQAMPAG